MDLRNRILGADPSLTVGDVVSPALLARISPSVKAAFQRMRLDWQPNRSWGQSFNIGDSAVKVGHRMGDHVATYPAVHGMSDDQAGEFLRLQVEGTLLHELGHAMLDHALEQDPRLWQEMAMAALSDGAPSTYRGHCIGGRMLQPLSMQDRLHEMYAEAFRYWCHNHPAVQGQIPTWSSVANRVSHMVR